MKRTATRDGWVLVPDDFDESCWEKHDKYFQGMIPKRPTIITASDGYHPYRGFIFTHRNKDGDLVAGLDPNEI